MNAVWWNGLRLGNREWKTACTSFIRPTYNSKYKALCSEKNRIKQNSTIYKNNQAIVFTDISLFQDVIKTIGEVPVDGNTAVPKRSIRIIDSGTIDVDHKYELQLRHIDSDEDCDDE